MNNGPLERILRIWEQQDQLRAGRERPPLEGRAAIIARAKLYIAKEPPAIEGQHGSDRCFHVAAVLVKDFALTEAEALEAIQDWNQTCKPPWSVKELRHKLADAAKKPGPVGKLLGQPATNGHVNGYSANPNANAAFQRGLSIKPAGEDWEAPVPLGIQPATEPFPISVFPEPLQAFAEECAWATNSPIDFAALPMLGLAAGAIGNARLLAITRTHLQPASLFVAVVGLPGSGKSPCLDLIKEYLERAERAHFKAWKQAVLEWGKEDKDMQVPRPILRRTLIDDTTTEAMVRALSENPRGLTMIRDELAALVAGMDQYKDGGKGNDRQTYLKIWSGSTIRVDRKSNVDGIPLSVRRPFLSIVGGVQPQVIEGFRGDRDSGREPPNDGFLDRFLIGHPAPLPAVGETWREVSPATANAWETALQTLLDLEMENDAEGDLRPVIVHLTPEGRMAWSRFTEDHAAELNATDFPEHMRGPWAKLRGYCGRLALVLHLLRQACGEAASDSVDGESVHRGAALVAYFKSQARRLHAEMGLDPRVEAARKVLLYLSSRPSQTTTSRRDLYADLRRSFRRPEDLEAPLRLLCEHRYARPLPEMERSGPGRRPTPRYEINPLWKRHEIQTIQSMAVE